MICFQLFLKEWLFVAVKELGMAFTELPDNGAGRTIQSAGPGNV